MTVVQRKRIVIKNYDNVHHIHTHALICRDLNPTNILINSSSKRLVIHSTVKKSGNFRCKNILVCSVIDGGLKINHTKTLLTLMWYGVVPSKNFQHKNLSHTSFITRKFPYLQYMYMVCSVYIHCIILRKIIILYTSFYSLPQDQQC